MDQFFDGEVHNHLQDQKIRSVFNGPSANNFSNEALFLMVCSNLTNILVYHHSTMLDRA